MFKPTISPLKRVRLSRVRAPQSAVNRIQPKQRQVRFQSSQTTTSTSDIVFSAIQPTGIPHLGNYLGALRQWVQLQNTAPAAKFIYSVADLHAITLHQEPEQLRKWRRESFAALLAVGLNPERSIIFFQSNVPAHAELMWILSCSASMGYLSRMTQWKSKLSLPATAAPTDAKSREKLKLGLFSYPVLQAADILLYRANKVPVGADQLQHLEFARDVAVGFNYIYGNILVPPQPVLSPARRIMSLRDPTIKMSKSNPDPRSRILITDSRDEIREKIRLAVTDSIPTITYDTANRPGVSNLLEIMSHIEDGTRSPEDLAREFHLLDIREFKERVWVAIDNVLAPIRDRYEQFVQGHDAISPLEEMAELGAEKAQACAAETMNAVKTAVGFA